MNPTFRIWLEANGDRPLVFCDMDETLVHRMETGWLKGRKENKQFIRMVTPGEHPYPDVKLIKHDNDEVYVFPRPGSIEFLKSINEFADLYILSHAGNDYLTKVIDEMKWKPYIKEHYSTRDLSPGDLGQKYQLDRKKWILVDNLRIHSIEIVSKMRILGLGSSARDPRAALKQIVPQEDEHYIDVTDWVPTVYEYEDFELWQTVPKIKQKLGLDFTQDDKHF